MISFNIDIFVDKNIFFTKHHLERYFKFINMILDRSDISKKEIFIEKHHILPISLFNEYRDDPTNIIKLSTREHYIAHLMLAFAIGGNQWHSVNMMCSVNNPKQGRHMLKISSRTIAIIKQKHYFQLSQNMKASRANETQEQKLARVQKWKDTQAAKSIDQIKTSRAKGTITARANKLLNPDTYGKDKKPRNNQCATCGTLYGNKHTCKGKIIQKVLYEKQKLERSKIYCKICNKKFRLEKNFIKHNKIKHTHKEESDDEKNTKN